MSSVSVFQEVVTSYLTDIGHSYVIKGDEVMTTCLNPEHHDRNPSFGINTTKLVGHCFSCGFSVSPRYFSEALPEDLSDIIWDAKYKHLQSVMSPEEVKTAVQISLPPKAYDINRDWRGVSQSLLSKLGAYYCDRGKYAGRLVFPIYVDGELKGFDARIVNPSVVPSEDLMRQKWTRPYGMAAQDIVYPYNLLKELPPKDRQHAVLCEGVADCISYWEMGVPAICGFGIASPGGGRIASLLRLGVTHLTIAFDSDEAGQTASRKVFKDYVQNFFIVPHKLATKIHFSSYKDANEYLEGVGAVPKVVHEIPDLDDDYYEPD